MWCDATHSTAERMRDRQKEALSCDAPLYLYLICICIYICIWCSFQGGMWCDAKGRRVGKREALWSNTCVWPPPAPSKISKWQNRYFCRESVQICGRRKNMKFFQDRNNLVVGGKYIMVEWECKLWVENSICWQPSPANWFEFTFISHLIFHTRMRRRKSLVFSTNVCICNLWGQKGWSLGF